MKTLFKHLLPLLAFALIASSCSKSPEYKLCYSDEDGNTVVTEKTTKDMLKSLKKSKWPYTWDKETFKLTVGEISEEIETIIDPVDQMFVVQFARCPEGVIVTEATAITGKRKIPPILGSSGISPEEHLEMDPAFAVMMPFHLGKYEKK